MMAQQEVDIFEPSRGILEPRPMLEEMQQQGAGRGVCVRGAAPVVVGIGEVMEGARW